MDSDFIDIDQTCELTGLSRGGLAQLRFRGEGPPFYAITPRKIRYRETEVVEWMASKRRQSTADSALAG
ncbi:MAG: helix-turn-helix domain-containing protein [Microcella sp.]|uniref:helix-turn-helix transcriptional regulator n=1 Tax=Microcella sp. TaxID=1913979 RepID=UPI00271F5920|nr:helix-turn-helix domain-containing protein [Microcella sp.]MDO8338440.1 helix-turn-helix domain-containing protein [Microcella sp.]